MNRFALLLVPILCATVSKAVEPTALEQADAALKAAAPKAAADPERPVYHFRAPAHWMNDPNGPIFYKGFYHVFYQSHPFGDGDGPKFWGHARSKDLLHWDQLPMAIAPSADKGETGIWSGCCALNADGKPTIFYTSIGKQREPEQWAAVPEDDTLFKWTKLDKPVLTQADNGPQKVREWRDPFIFKDAGKTYLVTGGMSDVKNGAVQLYESTGGDLTQWKRRGVLHTEPGDIECPLFFKLQGKWVLCISIHGHAKYHTGTFDSDAGTFRSEKSAWLDESDNFYAPNTLEDPEGHRILIGWIRGWNPGRGWNGCFSLPRELTLAPDGTLRQLPIGETSALFGEEVGEEAFKLPMAARRLANAKGDAACLFLKYDPTQAKGVVGFNVRCSADGKRKVPISYDGANLNVAGTKYPLAVEGEEGGVLLVVFIDESVLEVFAQNGRVCITKVLKDQNPADADAELFSDKGEVQIEKLKSWPMKSAYEK